MKLINKYKSHIPCNNKIKIVFISNSTENVSLQVLALITDRKKDTQHSRIKKIL